MTSATRGFARRARLSRDVLRALGVATALLLTWAALPVGVEGVVDALGNREGPARRLPALSEDLATLERRASALEREGRALEDLEQRLIVPLAATLSASAPIGSAEARRIARALLREGRRANVDPRLLLSVMLVEDPTLDPTAVSRAGAVGLMQVMPFHAGGWACAGDDLVDPEDNICHGARILANTLRRTRGDLRSALLLYNGCTSSAGVADCYSYPDKVYARVIAQGISGRSAGRGPSRTMVYAGGRAPESLTRGDHDR